MKKLIPKNLDRDIKLYLFEGAKLFMFETYPEERAVFIEHSDGDVTIASWVEGREEVLYLNISEKGKKQPSKLFSDKSNGYLGHRLKQRRYYEQ
jgi:hypothetical protein